MNLPLLFASAFVVALSGALMPGPLLTVTVAHSPRFGWTFGPLAILGHAILELGLISLVFLGAGPLLKSGAVQSIVGLVGGAILIWMSWGMVAMARAGGGIGTQEGAVAGSNRAVWLGILTSISNPYWTLWWATVGLAFLTTAAKSGPLGITVFFLGHISGDLAWYTLVSVGAARGKKFLGTYHYCRVLFLCAAILVVLGVWFVWYGGKLALGG
ncbi:MAG: LysE family transporter [bacterium]|nr:LysE family transporter [bacterium]MDT8365250.1 LysE family transporter [bacterium]